MPSFGGFEQYGLDCDDNPSMEAGQFQNPTLAIEKGASA
jgi:hypothetical protein